MFLFTLFTSVSNLTWEVKLARGTVSFPTHNCIVDVCDSGQLALNEYVLICVHKTDLCCVMQHKFFA